MVFRVSANWGLLRDSLSDLVCGFESFFVFWFVGSVQILSGDL